ncbi:AraC family transcriptional regulator ligand-binding domain-containing protein [Nocardia sp. NPDC046763]|uniref:AraC family transcriptional regulator n=1 Tax=Nocardia sp. NPDC046763 TaxID=3155256 RepID=UPI0033F621C7
MESRELASAHRGASLQRPALANTVSSHMVRLVLDTAKLAGVQGPHLAHIGGLDRSLLPYNRTRIPTADLYRLWEVLARTAGREMGVRAAATAEFGRLHVWDYLIRSAPTLADGFRDAARFSAVLCDPIAEFHVKENGDQLQVTYVDTPTNEPVDIVHREFALAVAVRRAREGFGPAATPVRVDFAHHAPTHREYLVKSLGTDNIHFDQRSDTITFLTCGSASGSLEHEHDPQLREILHYYAQGLIDNARPEHTWLDTFRSALRETLSSSNEIAVTLDAVAHRLVLSTRTLQRRLTAHDTTWRVELETARRELAVALLHNPALPVKSIAHQLGYRDQQTLSRAFHQWTGQSPSTYRRSL